MNELDGVKPRRYQPASQPSSPHAAAPQQTQQAPRPWTTQRVASLAAVCALSLASRIPFLAAGYGRDPDALRVVNAARALRATGEYSSSRHPGYPVQEYVVSWLLPGGVWAVNGMSALMSCACTLFFALCLQELAVPAANALALALAFVPVVYINSTCAMDYVWALAFVLAAAWLSLRERPWLAGLCLGLAIGARITSGAMLVPLALLSLAARPGRAAWVRIAQLTASALAVGAACFSPVYLRYGAKLWTYSQGVGAGSTEAILRRATWSVWGVLGCLALAAALLYLLLTLPAALRRLRARPRRFAGAACVSAIAIYVLAYGALPHEAGYLIPIVPFTIWLIAMALPQPPSLVLAALLMAAPFVGHKDGALTLAGPLLADHRERAQVQRLVSRAIAAADRLRASPRRTLIVAGYRLPAIEAALGAPPDQRQRWLYLIKNKAQLAGFREQGYDVYVIDRATEAYQWRVNRLKLRALGVKRLPLDP